MKKRKPLNGFEGGYCGEGILVSPLLSLLFFGTASVFITLSRIFYTQLSAVYSVAGYFVSLRQQTWIFIEVM